MTETTYTPDQRPSRWTRSANGSYYATTAQGQYLIAKFHSRAWMAVRLEDPHNVLLCENQPTMREARACVEWDRWHRLSAADVYDTAVAEHWERTTLAAGNLMVEMPTPAEPKRQFCRKGVHTCVPAVTLTFDNGARALHWCAEHVNDADRYRADSDQADTYQADTYQPQDTIVELAAKLVDLGSARARLLMTNASIAKVRENIQQVNAILAEIERQVAEMASATAELAPDVACTLCHPEPCSNPGHSLVNVVDDEDDGGSEDFTDRLLEGQRIAAARERHGAKPPKCAVFVCTYPAGPGSFCEEHEIRIDAMLDESWPPRGAGE